MYLRVCMRAPYFNSYARVYRTDIIFVLGHLFAECVLFGFFTVSPKPCRNEQIKNPFREITYREKIFEKSRQGQLVKYDGRLKTNVWTYCEFWVRDVAGYDIKIVCFQRRTRV